MAGGVPDFSFGEGYDTVGNPQLKAERKQQELQEAQRVAAAERMAAQEGASIGSAIGQALGMLIGGISAGATYEAATPEIGTAAVGTPGTEGYVPAQPAPAVGTPGTEGYVPERAYAAATPASGLTWDEGMALGAAAGEGLGGGIGLAAGAETQEPLDETGAVSQLGGALTNLGRAVTMGATTIAKGQREREAFANLGKDRT